MTYKAVGIILLLLVLTFTPGCQTNRIEELEQELVERSEDLCAAEQELKTCNISLEESQEKEHAVRGQVEGLESQIAGLENELAKIPKNPSYDELMKFVEDYKTSDEVGWGHSSYLQDFLRNAARNGIKGYPISVWIKAQKSWFFAGFLTTDKGWIYILPEEEGGEEVKLEINKKFNEQNGTPSLKYDDTILKVVIFN